MYPVTIIMDRYHGAYSGGAWLAFDLDSDSLPSYGSGGDTDEMNFWCDANKAEHYLIGRGETPNEALEDLERRVKNEV